MLVLLRYNSESIQSYCLLYTKKILVIHLTVSLILSLKGILFKNFSTFYTSVKSKGSSLKI